MSAAAEARLRAIVARVSQSCGIDPSAADVRIACVFRPSSWRADVVWDSDALPAVTEWGATPDEAAESVRVSIIERSCRSIERAERVIVESREAIARWSAVRAAAEVAS